MKNAVGRRRGSRQERCFRELLIDMEFNYEISTFCHGEFPKCESEKSFKEKFVIQFGLISEKLVAWATLQQLQMTFRLASIPSHR